jgi:uncharacterized protein YkwD
MSSTAAWRKWYRAVGQAAIGATAIAVAGCGGGGDNATPPAASTPAPSPSPSPAPSPAAPSTAAATCGLPNFTASLLARVNQARAAGANCGSEGVFAATGPVTWNNVLTQAATGHSQDMATNNYFSHTSLDGRTLSQRVDATGYHWSMLGENIAAGQIGVDAVVNAWMGSPGHCANIMRPELTEMGVACVPGTASDTYATYWTMDLGRPR